jgi:glycosyltransferase involved in cell wall biosynthesis
MPHANLPDWTQEPGRVAIVHDWMTGMRGGEAILDAICELFPRADLFTLLQTDFSMSLNILNGRTVHTSYLQKLMGIHRFAEGYRQLLPLFPHAIESLDLSEFDLVISNTHCVAKGARKREGALHLSYVSTPMRYVWDMFDDYFGPGKSGLLTALGARLLRRRLQDWDRRSTSGVDHLIANSRFVQERIRKFWGRESEVIHPFVDPTRFEDRFEEPRDYYLIISAFAPYKRIDLAVEAFRRLGTRLIIVGKGQDEARLRRLARGATNVEFHGGLSNRSLGELYRKARALVFPGLEDFGITPLESMFNGRPVIAYGRGGLLDTVTETTGVLFPEQTVESLMEAVNRFEQRMGGVQPGVCRARALEFGREAFQKRFSDFVTKRVEERFSF